MTKQFTRQQAIAIPHFPVEIHTCNADPLKQCPDLLYFHLRALVHSQLGPHHLLEEVEVHGEVRNTKGVLQAFPCLLSGGAQVGAEVGGTTSMQ